MRTSKKGLPRGAFDKRMSSVFLLLFLAVPGPVSAYNSEEHRLIGDRGVAAVKIPAGVKMPDSLQPQPVTPDIYTESIVFAKQLSVGFDPSKPLPYDTDKKRVQDNYYKTSFGQSKYNRNIWLPPASVVPATVVNVPTHCGPGSTSMTFGELISLYGDYRRTVYSISAGECAMTDKDIQQIDFQRGSYFRSSYAPRPVAASRYLRAIASGLVPPFGAAGNVSGETANPKEYTEAAWWGDEMLRIAATNDFHFSNGAIAWYVGLHRLALVYVDKARENPDYWVNALHYEACALHGLTDLFAFGHVVVNRGAASRAAHTTSNNLKSKSYQWMEHTLRLGGAVRGRDGRLSLGSELPPITEVQTTRENTMPWKQPLSAASTGLASKDEKDYHDQFNDAGAVVKNLRGDTFLIHGDDQLRITPRALTMGARAVEESVQSLVRRLRRTAVWQRNHRFVGKGGLTLVSGVESRARVHRCGHRGLLSRAIRSIRQVHRRLVGCRSHPGQLATVPDRLRRWLHRPARATCNEVHGVCSVNVPCASQLATLVGPPSGGILCHDNTSVFRRQHRPHRRRLC